MRRCRPDFVPGRGGRGGLLRWEKRGDDPPFLRRQKPRGGARRGAAPFGGAESHARSVWSPPQAGGLRPGCPLHGGEGAGKSTHGGDSMVTFFPLSSGSSGNSYYLSAGEGQGGLLIDAGISARRTRCTLCNAGIDPEGLRGILVTHDHTDHISGVRVLAKQLRLPIYATAGTLESLAGTVEAGTQLIPLEEEQEIAGMGISPFATQHDAPDSCGFRIEAGSRTIGFATDLGAVTATVWAHLLGCHLAVLESNYEDSVLMNCTYPYYLKQRIRSEYGHLSNAEAAKTVEALAQRGTAHFVLAHLSRESNTPALARSNTEAALSAAGMQPERDYRLWIAPRDGPGTMIRF